MSDVIDLAARRARCTTASLPQRDADIELQAWLKDDQINWIYSRGEFFDETPDHKTRAAALIDIAWTYGADTRPGEIEAGARPLFWVLLRGDGNMTLLYARSLFTDTSAKHAFWFARQWWRLTKKMVGLTWRIWRGRG